MKKYMCIIVMCISFLVTTQALAGVKETANQGLAFMNSGNYMAAIVKFDKVAKKSTNTGVLAITYFNLGVCFHHLGNYKDAEANFSKALHYKPKYEKALYMRAASYIMQGKFNKALQDSEVLVRNNPQNPQLLAQSGTIYQNLGKYKKALQDFNLALEKIHDDARLFYNRGVVQVNLRKKEKALADYLAAIKLNPKYVVALNSAAWLLATGPQPDGKKAIRLAKRALDLNHEWWIIDTLAAAYAQNKDFKNALKYQEAALVLAPAPFKKELQVRLNSYKQGKF